MDLLPLVKCIFPTAPDDIILADLTVTGSAELTINRIFDGQVVRSWVLWVQVG